MHTNDALFPLIEDKKKQVIRSWWRLYYCLFYGDLCKNKFFVSICNKKGRVYLYIIYLSTVPRVYIRHNLQFDRSCAIGLPPRLYSNANIQKERLMCVSIEIVYTLSTSSVLRKRKTFDEIYAYIYYIYIVKNNNIR
jgi:hypothetical protein